MARGVDPRVDYDQLRDIGPWDDRNYLLTAEDVALLSDNESALRVPIPAYYRAYLRRQMPKLPRTGEVQYPRKALNYFRRDGFGYLIDGKLYSRVTRTPQGYAVKTENPQSIVQVLAGLLEGTESQVNGAHAGASESAVAIHPTDDRIVIAGVNEIGAQGMYWSDDSSKTWHGPVNLQGNECCDPTVAWSSDGLFAYAATLGGVRDVWVYRSDDQGRTWNSFADDTPGDARREVNGGRPALSDKEYLHVDHAPSSPFRDHIYLTFQENFVPHFAVSNDLGNTFLVHGHDDEPDGIGSDITSDHNGRVYHFWPSVSARKIIMVRSDDGGLSFMPSVTVAETNANFGIPLLSQETREAFVYVSADTDLSGGPFHGRVYVAWTDTVNRDRLDPNLNHAIVRVAYSDDAGESWTDTTAHSLLDSGSVDRYHPWLAVAPTGQVLVGFYSTQQSPDRTGVDFYLARSRDGGQSWLPARRLSTETSPNIPDDFEFGDYNGLDVGENEVIAIFTDNRVDPDDTNSADQVDVVTARIGASPANEDDPEFCIRHPERCQRK